jgi:hypothetical protein
MHALWYDSVLVRHVPRATRDCVGLGCIIAMVKFTCALPQEEQLTVWSGMTGVAASQAVGSLVASVALSVILFAGPLVQTKDDDDDDDASFWRGFFDPASIVWWRNIVIVCWWIGSQSSGWRWFWLVDCVGWIVDVQCPVTEEWVFRACMVPLMIRAGFSDTQAILLTPLFFGIGVLHDCDALGAWILD